MPDVGEGLTEAEIVTWNVAVGDVVAVNQILCEIETAKAAVELPSPFAGTVGRAAGQARRDGRGGQPDHRDRDGRGGAGAAAAPAPADAGEGGAKIGEAGVGRPDRHPRRLRPPPRLGRPPPPPRRTPTHPALGSRRRRCAAPGRCRCHRAAVRWPRRAAVQGGVAATARPSGGPASSGPQPSSTVVGSLPPGDLAAAVRSQPAGAAASSPPDRSAAGPGRVVPLAKPPVRKLAKDLGVDLRAVVPSSPDGVITREDVQAHVAPAPAAAPAAPAVGGVRREPIRGVRRATAAAMVTSAFTAPHVTEFLTVDVTETMALRDRLRATPRVRRRQAHAAGVRRQGDVPRRPADARGEHALGRRGRGDRLLRPRPARHRRRHAARADRPEDPRRRHPRPARARRRARRRSPRPRGRGRRRPPTSSAAR